MKKIFLSIALAGTLLTSCDMDKAPVGSINDSDAIMNVNDCFRFATGINGNIRSLFLGSYMAYPEIQADNFQAIRALYGNRIGLIFAGDILSSNSDIEGMWSALYTRIANINYFLPRVDALIGATADFSESQIAEMRYYRGQAYFARALANYTLMNLFCPTPTADNLNTAALGAPLVTEYHPSADRDTYPGRSTLAETLKLINDDLKLAALDLAAYEAVNTANLVPGAPYPNSYAVKALEARVALSAGDKATAATKAQEVINSGLYQLADVDQYPTIWINDNPCREVIFQPVVTAAEAAGVSAYGNNWISADGDRADYVPTEATLAMYPADDIRFSSFFAKWDLTIGGAQYPTYVFAKYPGNPALTSGTVALRNAPKPFRISEMYLIVAEAATEMSARNAALNAVRAARIPSWNETTYTEATITNEVRLERNRELIGEGFRLTDLRRWGLGFKRDGSTSTTFFAPDFTDQFTSSKNLEYRAGDYRYVWPIPSGEIDVNPQLKGQQNAGY